MAHGVEARRVDKQEREAFYLQKGKHQIAEHRAERRREWLAPSNFTGNIHVVVFVNLSEC